MSNWSKVRPWWNESQLVSYTTKIPMALLKSWSAWSYSCWAVTAVVPSKILRNFSFILLILALCINILLNKIIIQNKNLRATNIPTTIFKSSHQFPFENWKSTSWSLVPSIVRRLITKAGLFVLHERNNEASVDLPLPLSAYIKVAFWNACWRPSASCSNPTPFTLCI